MRSFPAQHEDLKTAEAQLENIIQELDEGMRKQFTEKFARISSGSLTRRSRSCLAAERALWS